MPAQLLRLRKAANNAHAPSPPPPVLCRSHGATLGGVPRASGAPVLPVYVSSSAKDLQLMDNAVRGWDVGRGLGDPWVRPDTCE